MTHRSIPRKRHPLAWTSVLLLLALPASGCNDFALNGSLHRVDTIVPVPVGQEEDDSERSADGPEVPGCEHLQEQSGWCLAFDRPSGHLWVVGLDTRETCRVEHEPVAPTMPHNIAVLGDHVILTEQPFDGLQADIDLKTGSAAHFEIEADGMLLNLTDYDGGFIAQYVGPEAPGGVLFYEGLEEFLLHESSPLDHLDPRIGGRWATAGDTLWSAWHSTSEIERYDTESGEELPPLELDEYDNWIYGVDGLPNNRLVITDREHAFRTFREDGQQVGYFRPRDGNQPLETYGLSCFPSGQAPPIPDGL